MNLFLFDIYLYIKYKKNFLIFLYVIIIKKKFYMNNIIIRNYYIGKLQFI